MELTETKLELLFAAKVLATVPAGMIEDDASVQDADELVEAGWLERRIEHDGKPSWWWTSAAETALDVTELTSLSGPNLN